eukprot:4338143-Prymnesium_polylepis.2
MRCEIKQWLLHRWVSVSLGSRRGCDAKASGARTLAIQGGDRGVKRVQGGDRRVSAAGQLRDAVVRLIKPQHGQYTDEQRVDDAGA